MRAGRLGHPVCGVDSAGPVAQKASLLPAEEAADDVLRHRRERAGGVQAEAAQGVGLGGADAVRRVDGERVEEGLDGAVVGEVEDAGRSGVCEGGRGGRPGVRDADVDADAVRGYGLELESLREPAGSLGEHPARAAELCDERGRREGLRGGVNSAARSRMWR
ncbi:hypothetical protein [Streptomyces sp. KL110A]|uniref:hypothetical protein n=2 Tax=Streptomyces TaxID=1883 RepID=UPI0038BF2EAD